MDNVCYSPVIWYFTSSNFSNIMNKNSARPPTTSWPCFYDFQALNLPLHPVLSNFLVEHIVSCRWGKDWIKFIFIRWWQIWDSSVRKIWRTYFVGKQKKNPQERSITEPSMDLFSFKIPTYIGWWLLQSQIFPSYPQWVWS